MKTLHPYFVENLTAIMSNRGVSQTELARRIGVRPQHISEYVRGNKEPPLYRLEHIAEALKTTSGRLLAKPK